MRIPICQTKHPSTGGENGFINARIRFLP